MLENGVVGGGIFFLDAVAPSGRPWMRASGHDGQIKRAALDLAAVIAITNVPNESRETCPTERGLRAWACRIRTGESVRELSDWNCVTTWFAMGASRAAERLRVQAASNGFAAPAKVAFSTRSLAG